MITEWEALEGRTITKVRPFFLGGYVLLFEDGEVAHIDADGEERHGAHWPVLSEDYKNLVMKEGGVGKARLDLHAEMTARAFDVPYEEVTEEQRGTARNRAFAALYSSQEPKIEEVKE